jgi:MSHA biogenesis protein MshQ
MRLNNAYGSALLDLPLPLSVESYVVGGAFATNSADNCTTLQGSDLRFSFVATTPNLTACETAISPATNIYFYNGKASSTPASLTPAKLVKPGSNNNGSVDVGVNLNGVVGTIGRCTAQGAAGPTATNANIPWLQGNWGTASYNADPVGRATFGLFKSADEFIYLRENF